MQMYNCPTCWNTVVDEMSVDEMSVDEMSVDELSQNLPPSVCLYPYHQAPYNETQKLFIGGSTGTIQ